MRLRLPLCPSRFPLLTLPAALNSTSAKHSALATTVEVKFESQKYHLDSFWLRDNDPATVHPSTYQRLSPTALVRQSFPLLLLHLGSMAYL